MIFSVGDKAPDFTLFNTEKKQVTLSDLQGRPVLLLFFPLAFTSVCTKELCSVQDDLQWYNDLDVKVIAISVDSLHSLKKFKEIQELNFTMLSDFNKEVSASYGCLYDDFSYGMKGVSKRAAFVIDEKGHLQYAEVLEDPTRVPQFFRIRTILEQLSKS